jgi:hypothetical protein
VGSCGLGAEFWLKLDTYSRALRRHLAPSPPYIIGDKIHRNVLANRVLREALRLPIRPGCPGRAAPALQSAVRTFERRTR